MKRAFNPEEYSRRMEAARRENRNHREDEDEKKRQATAAQPKVASEKYTSATPPESLVTKYVNYSLRCTDAPPGAHELMIFGVMSALVGPKARLPLATNPGGWPLTMWLMYIVDSTVGRKSTVLDIALDF